LALKFYAFVLLLLSQPAFLIPLMITDELFSSLTDVVNLNTQYYWVPFIGRLDIWSSWETCFVILFLVYEAVFIYMFWVAVKKPNQADLKLSAAQTK